MIKHKEQLFDLTFIGAGLSCTYTLIHFIERLKKFPEKRKIQICILDKTNEFWTGIPYGNRSGVNSLIITSLKEFLPEKERKIFIDWLKKNNEVLKNYAETSGGLPMKWLQNNKHLIDSELWDKLYIPRYIFGKFLAERVTVLIESAVKASLISYTLFTAEVTDVQKEKNLLKVIGATPSGDELCIKSKKVILSIGSPPKNEVKVLNENSTHYLCIQDMYEPNLKENIHKINSYLKDVDQLIKKNILILGSNASSLEIIYNLQNYTQPESQINKYYILSPDGMFPHRINEEKVLSEYIPDNLISLKKSKSNTCEQILEAVRKDVETANKKKIAIADIYAPVSHIIIQLLATLNKYEQKQFVYTYGVEIGKLQRRAGGEYLDCVNKLIDEKRLEFIKGKFIRQVHSENYRFQFEYEDFHDGVKKVFSEPVNILINCVGAADLKKTFSELIQNLIKKKLCAVNGSEKGFIVNENFESIENFFVIGPLLSGTLNKTLRIWHAESCPRIFFLSQQLANSLSNSLV